LPSACCRPSPLSPVGKADRAVSLPDPLRADQVERLAQELRDDEASSPEPAQAVRKPDGAAPPGMAAMMRRTARGALRRIAKPAMERATEPGRNALEQVAQLDRTLAMVKRDGQEREQQWERDRSDLDAAQVNLELLKGEFRATQAALESLGRAIAPAFGLSEAATSLAELRERVAACERRLRHLEKSGSSDQSPANPATPDVPRSADGGGAPPSSTLFDYAGFERRFRGPPDQVLAVLDNRYSQILESHPPVLDIGCGRAELVGLLARRGVAAIGVDTDPSMVADAREQRLDVVQADAVSYLRAQPPATFGAIVATHVLEHLPLDALLELLELSQTRLRPGGVFIAETPNPSSLNVLGNSYILDPTHVRPLHPKLLEFLCESAGFRHVEVRFFSPATDLQLELITDPDAPEWAMSLNTSLAHLNQVLFGPQDFAIVATTAEATTADAVDPEPEAEPEPEQASE
jgi:SAM-dependent methyltransferase